MARMPAKCVLAAAIVLAWGACASAQPDQTVMMADQTLREIMAIPARSIPASLLADAQGLAIIPNVLKIGFVAGLRRGHGVVLVREPNGAWSLPQFITLTGGSVGWQAGIQDTDVVLVFTTKKSVDGLMQGKFTIGADAAAAAGPVGRNAAAATDARLRAEILSYSRSRGLFVGLSLDGTALEIDPTAQIAYYGVQPGQPVTQVPESAMRLLATIQAATQGAPVDTRVAAPAGPPVAVVPNQPPSIRQTLAQNATQLYGVLDEPWRKFLTLPKEVFEVTGTPPLSSIETSLKQFDRVATDPKYASLANRGEFQATYQTLKAYVAELSTTSSATINLPPPPTR